MTIDLARLLAYPVPEVRQKYTSHQSAFYALSTGMGQDPLDERHLDFVDPNREAAQRVLPSMALVLGYPGFWLVRPDTTVDPTRILHGTQEVEWQSTLPPSGEVIGRTRVVRVVDRGEGKHGMVESERTILDAHSGELYATLRQVHVLRGQGGFGGDPTPLPSAHALPERPPELVVELATRPEQALLYRLNGDLFALHADPAMARRSGFARPILHGMCVAGMATHALMRLLAGDEPSCMQSIKLRFSAAVFPGETVRVEAWRDGSFRARVVERNEVVLDNGHLNIKTIAGGELA
ncbi:MaoC/PaaZ C-terminal domain-containing protein [Variovorax guangxiensis]|uniref:MaoC/PaaZ C-terminal domain-containing protein n=1 Tax=Variovorax guangxiensis TaxID=1775474 RepID=UPI00285AE144|nr:MaoC/PaaZ C-terminal domain-containing protein [Variovorax guangxiensis]MDR6858760.1 acyl dehydratase [Variovorax guangxiensis]